MGAIVDEAVKTVDVDVVVEDGDADDKIAKIELLEDGVVVATEEPAASKYRWTTIRSPEPGQHYYFIKVTQADGNALWSAPVWVTVGGDLEMASRELALIKGCH
jgi:hypothetical protein